jgi:ABC-type uncharacterized transport system involved in gliding motility auxiliary subunit
MNVDTQSAFQATNNPNHYNDLISKWGLAVEPSIVADANHDYANFNQGYVTFTLPYPFFVKASNLDKNNSITQDLESFVIPWGSPIKITSTTGVTTEVLATTSKNYKLFTESDVTAPASSTPTDGSTAADQPKTVSQPVNLDPQQDFGITNESKEPLPLAVIAQKQGEGKIIVVGDSDFVAQGSANQVFIQNAIDALTLGNELISIRSKGLTDRPLTELSETSKNIFRWGLIIGLPLLFVIYGLYRRYSRRQLKTMKI